MKILFAFAFSLIVCAVGATETAVLNNSTNNIIQWGAAANWNDGSGNPLSAAPVSDVDITLPTWGTIDKTTVLQTLTTGTGGLTPAAAVPAVSVRNIEGPASYHVRIGDDPTTGKYVTATPTFSVVSPDLFLGYWTFGTLKSTLTVNPASATEATLAHFVSTYMPTVNVPEAADTATVGDLTGNGLLLKTGDGTLAIASSGESDAYVSLAGGTLSIGGGAFETELARLLPLAALHLDASVTNTLHESASACGDDFTNVDAWDDVRGNGNGAKTSTFGGGTGSSIPFVNPAYRSTVTSQTGLPLVDFGACGYKPAQWQTGDRTNCVMELVEPLSNVREAFYAVSTPYGGGSTTILGAKDRYDFLCEGNTLFASNAYASVTCGDMALNGEHCAWNRVIADYDAALGVYVVSVGTAANATVGLLGSRNFCANDTGNVRLGEVLLFTNALTKAERACVNRYLTAKWVRGTNATNDLGHVLQTAEAPLTVNVPAGNDARIGAVTLKTTDQFVKTGEGRLTVGTLSPADAAVRIEGGTVAFGDSAITPKVADGAYLWLDAARMETIVTNEEGLVTAWQDCRSDVTREATVPDVAPGKPTVIESCAEVGGRRVLSFENRKAWMKLPTWNDGVRHAFAGFMVVRQNDPNCVGGERPLFGSSSLALYRNGTPLRDSGYPSEYADTAHWSINARPINPYVSEPELEQITDFYVVAFTSDKPLLTDALFKDRADTEMATNCGDADIGEYILYHRPISAEEFAATEAYLMEKWLGKTHPRRAKFVPSALAFPAASDRVLDFASDARLKSISGGTGTYVKRSAGTVEVNLSDMTNDNQSVTVEAGALVVSDDLATEEPERSFGYASVAVNDGASLSLPRGRRCQIASLAGVGAVSAGTVTDLASLGAGADAAKAETLSLSGDFTLAANATVAVSLTAEGTCDRIAVDGALGFAGAVTVNVSATGQSVTCDCPVMSATSLEGVDLSAWTLVVPSEATHRRIARLYVKNNAVWLRIGPSGMSAFLR